MRVSVIFGDKRLELDVPDDQLVGVWEGPADLAVADLAAQVEQALNAPREFPPLGMAMVPGDRLVIALDGRAPAKRPILDAIGGVARAAGVEPDAIRALVADADPADLDPAWLRHDPDDETRRAYLASTKLGHRVYLDRELTDADIVVPVGALGFDPVLGHRGPWSTIFPGLSDAETVRGFHGRLAEAKGESSRLAEPAEVSWLLGCQYHLGVVPGAGGGAAAVLGGEAEVVRREGIAAVDRLWTFRCDTRAEIVVAGVGGPGQTTTLGDLARALETATALVRRGGKIVALTDATGPLGPAMQLLAGLDDPRYEALAALKRAKGEPDHGDALALAKAIGWADVYVLSRLDDDEAESLSLVPLGSADEAGRLVRQAASVTVLSRAELTRAIVADPDA